MTNTDDPVALTASGQDAYRDLARFVELPRLGGLTVDAAGERVIAAVSLINDERSGYTSSLWEVPTGTGEPVRLTHGAKGESAPAFAPDGSVLFLSSRPHPSIAEDETALWRLPVAGEAELVTHLPGGVSGFRVAGGSGAIVVAGSRLAGTDERGDDAERRARRKERKVSAILHSGMPIRFWDHEVGDTRPGLYLVESEGDDVGVGLPRDLAPDAGMALLNADFSVSADGRHVATTWRTMRSRGRFPYGVALIDIGSGDRRMLLAEDGAEFAAPRIAPDATLVAALRETEMGYSAPWRWSLLIVPTSSAADAAVEVQLEDLYPTEWTWSADSTLLYVAGDLHGRGAVVAVDPVTGSVVEWLASDAVYSELHPVTDGSALYAVRSTYDSPPAPVVLGRATSTGVRHLSTPAPVPSLPGDLIEVRAPHHELEVHGWLCLPSGADASHPVPVMTWVHGGPFLSANAWSWRWNPWIAVARGWAVVLPDPALSTGYGTGAIDRAWPYRADVVWSEVESVLDEVLRRPDTDGSRLMLGGGSFGGFMANWIAGHSDRFGAIFSHAGLWAADQQHATTDGAAFKTGLFGRPADHPDWYEAYSPHRSLNRIRTPMLISHGNRDYRVPVSEALRLWWDLVGSWDGEPEELPHRFLQFTGENHWVLNPSNFRIWWETVLAFCAHHVLGDELALPDLL